MKIQPHDLTIHQLFEQHKLFRIPIYQRGYAWSTDQVNDFLDDIKTIVDRKLDGDDTYTHFFGGVVSVEKDVERSYRHEYKVIDGQQRLATFILFITNLRESYKEIEDKISDDLKNRCKKRIDNLNDNYLNYEHTSHENGQPKYLNIRRLVLNTKDDNHFNNLINKQEVDTGKLESNDLLTSTYKKCKTRLRAWLKGKSNDEKFNFLELIDAVLKLNCKILHIITDNKSNAYTLFQVLNDRGTSLTNGDLIKAEVLELLDGFNHQQQQAVEYWDDILKDSANDIENNLMWVYSSFSGSRGSKTKLHRDFCSLFFNYEVVHESDANEILEKTKEIKDCVKICRILKEGESPIPISPKYTQWHVNRVRNLIKVLGNTAAIPVLLSASKYDEKLFSKITDILERFFFRYKILCQAHATPLVILYNRFAKELRNDSNCIDSFEKELKKLMKNKANDDAFKSSLVNLEYKDNTKKYIKHLLLSIEYFENWLNNGHNGAPQPNNISTVYSNDLISLEHVYARNSREKDNDLEPIKNKIGNLTIMDSNENSKLGDKKFLEKKAKYCTSTMSMTRKVGSIDNWSFDEYEKRMKNLIDSTFLIYSFS